MKEEEKILNDPFVQYILTKKENRMPVEEIQKWVDRCKAEVKLSKPRHDGDDILGWADECEAWLLETTKEEGVKFNMLDTPIFIDMLQYWLVNYYDSVA